MSDMAKKPQKVRILPRCHACRARHALGTACPIRVDEPDLTLLVKLGSIVVHAKEFLSDDGHPFDRLAMIALIEDKEIRVWLQAMDDLALLPKTRASK